MKYRLAKINLKKKSPPPTPLPPAPSPQKTATTKQNKKQQQQTGNVGDTSERRSGAHTIIVNLQKTMVYLLKKYCLFRVHRYHLEQLS